MTVERFRPRRLRGRQPAVGVVGLGRVHGVRCLGGVAALPHFADKADALARQGLDQALLVSAVADRFAHGVDARAERRFRHDPPVPDLFYDFVPADNLLAVTDQMQEKVECLWLHGDHACATAQLSPTGIEDEFVKKIKQIQRLPYLNGHPSRAKLWLAQIKIMNFLTKK